ncbi:unnamed protein product [Adineta ricciae]|uniref:Uncharacterized protein n=1 Tax=Adineta ricciae TaxID=249248 RepID=A0A815JFB0_ADIRI|nr:unnamed protein product [Adineta ricciae]
MAPWTKIYQQDLRAEATHHVNSNGMYQHELLPSPPTNYDTFMLVLIVLCVIGIVLVIVLMALGKKFKRIKINTPAVGRVDSDEDVSLKRKYTRESDV